MSTDLLTTLTRSADSSPTHRLRLLTDRDREVLTLMSAGRSNLGNRPNEICRGHSTADIAARLGLSDKTVRNYTSAVLTKLQARDRAALVALAREAGYPRG